MISFDGLAGAFMGLALPKAVSEMKVYLNWLGFAQLIAPVKPEKLAFQRSKPAAKSLIDLALAQRVGAAFDQQIDLLRRQREPRRNRVQDARARRPELVEIDPVDEEADVAATPVRADAEARTFRC